MRQPWMAMLRWMVAVAVIVLLFYGGIGGVWLWRRHNYYLARAHEYDEGVYLARSHLQSLISESKRVDPRYDQWFTRRENDKADLAAEIDYAAEMASKYRHGARYPWLSIEHELPEPWW
jgi:hypothetical protein